MRNFRDDVLPAAGVAAKPRITHMDDTALKEHRMALALATKGTSPYSVYYMALRLMKEHKVKGDLLEFGAGIGTMISQLHANGYEGKITGVDMMARPADIPADIEWRQADLNDKTDLPDACFDAILSTEVIEHLENPRAVFREFHRLLRPDGTLIMTTPNQESLRSLLSLVFGTHFAAFVEGAYPLHITALIRKDLEHLCLETGFASPEFAFDNSGSIPKFPWLRFENFGLKGRLFSDGIAIVTKKIEKPKA